MRKRVWSHVEENIVENNFSKENHRKILKPSPPWLKAVERLVSLCRVVIVVRDRVFDWLCSRQHVVVVELVLGLERECVDGKRVCVDADIDGDVQREVTGFVKDHSIVLVHAVALELILVELGVLEREGNHQVCITDHRVKLNHQSLEVGLPTG